MVVFFYMQGNVMWNVVYGTVLYKTLLMKSISLFETKKFIKYEHLKDPDENAYCIAKSRCRPTGIPFLNL